MRINSNVPDCAMYTINYYGDKYVVSLFAHFKYTVKIYAHNFTHLSKMNITNRPLLYININTSKIRINTHK